MNEEEERARIAFCHIVLTSAKRYHYHMISRAWVTQDDEVQYDMSMEYLSSTNCCSSQSVASVINDRSYRADAGGHESNISLNLRIK